MTYSKISAAQCRGARAMLGISQRELADAAKVSRPTVVDFERGARVPHPNNMAAIRQALEVAGIEFIPENSGGPGVRLVRHLESK
ncbi:helix-turn-helix domain-containing protein [Mesorhizobium sp. M0074]|uniref:helix-turn-helix domain-containing protein n=2 Tax=Mesorhizobium TaxID=68287 RepID=UPI00333BC3D7